MQFAALFIRPEILSLQQLTISLHACLSLGAKPSCTRFPIEPLQVSVKVNRFPPTLPQSGALINVWGTAVVTGAIKKPLTTAFGLHPLRIPRGQNACVSGFIWLCATTTGLILTGNQKGCQEPYAKYPYCIQYLVMQWGFLLPLRYRGKGLLQGAGEPACGVV